MKLILHYMQNYKENLNIMNNNYPSHCAKNASYSFISNIALNLQLNCYK